MEILEITSVLLRTLRPKETKYPKKSLSALLLVCTRFKLSNRVLLFNFTWILLLTLTDL